MKDSPDTGGWPPDDEVSSTVVLDEPPSPRLERRIGNYRLVQKIGEGGMSTVYLAVRAAVEYRQRVAIKLLQVDIASDENLRRLRNERQILAGLDHPYIARLFDGGTTPEGHPYLVMEYIEGDDILEYCRKCRLPLRPRLELFLKVCSAVQFAHRNLIVHRDLKPGNILVRRDGEPRLLDFGIAKLLAPDLLGTEPGTTRSDARAMTPEYASPEQIRGEPVTTASDVYSLGVLLYRLLTGVHPYDVSSQSIQDIARNICEEHPTIPSSLVGLLSHSSLDYDPPYDNRDWQKLERQLRGDLDKILLEALHKEPDRRYASVEQLSSDLERYLRGLPVEARGNDWLYLTRKFVARHRWGVGAVIALIFLLSAFGITMAAQSARIAGALQRVEQEAAKSEAINQFLRGTLASAATNHELTVVEALKTASREIESSLGQQPELGAALRATIGTTFRELGYYTESEVMLEEALEMRRRLHGEDHPEVASSLDALALLRASQQRYADAESLARKSLSIRRRWYGEEHAKVAESLHNVAAILQGRGDLAEAERLARQVVEMDRRLLAADDPDRVISLQNLATLLHLMGRYEEALELFQKSLQASESALGAENPLVALTRANLASLLSDLGRYDAAEEELREALDVRRRALGENHPSVSFSRGVLGDVLRKKGRLEEARRRLAEAVEAQRRSGDRRGLGTSLRAYGLTLLEMGRLDQARAPLEEALELNRSLLGRRHPMVPSSLLGLADLHLARGELELAESYARESLEISTDQTNGPDTAAARSRLAACLIPQGREGEGEQHLLAALEWYRTHVEPSEIGYRETLRDLIALYESQGRTREARRYAVWLAPPPVMKLERPTG